LRRRVDQLVVAREELLRRLSEMPGVRPYPSRANFFLIEFLEADPKAVFEALYRRGVLVRDVTSYPRLSRCLRVSVGCESENAAFLEALSGALSESADGRL
jgi:histidinol-phosphate aminotransferase